MTTKLQTATVRITPGNNPGAYGWSLIRLNGQENDHGGYFGDLDDLVESMEDHDLQALGEVIGRAVAHGASGILEVAF